MNKVIITSPSLNASQNVSGISTIVNLIVSNNKDVEYIHFELGKRDCCENAISRALRLAKNYRAWKQLLSQHSDAIIHYSFPLSRLSIIRDFFFLNYCIRKNRKLVVHIHGGQFLTCKEMPCYLKYVSNKVFSWNVLFVVLSDYEAEMLKKRFKAKIVYSLPNCVSIDKAENSRKKWNCDNSHPLSIGYLGRIEPNKGMKELLHACECLKNKGVRYILNIAGIEQKQDEFLPLFNKYLGEDFRYWGVVSGKSKNDFLSNLDIFVLPSYFEGLPMSLLECMSYGVVPIVTPVGSIPEVVKDGENGLFIKVKDVNSIVDTVKRLNSDKSMLKSLGECARDTIIRDFLPDNYIRQLNEIYITLM